MDSNLGTIEENMPSKEEGEIVMDLKLSKSLILQHIKGENHQNHSVGSQANTI